MLVLGKGAQDVPSVVAQAAALHERGVRIRSLTMFYEEWLAKLPLSELERASLLFDIGEVHRAGYGRAKRIIDVPLALSGCVVLAVVTPLVWLSNLMGNRGPLLYRQQRVGKGGTVFTILKFRTMAPRSGGDLVDEWTSEDDPRITRFGRVLRKTHVDELPQVVNVLRGDLSIVGPRPEQPRYVTELTDEAALLPPSPPRPARADGLGPGEVRLRRQRDRCPREAPVRVLVPPAPEPADRRSHHRPDDPLHPGQRGSRAMSAPSVGVRT